METRIILPAELAEKAMLAAAERGVTISELVQSALEQIVSYPLEVDPLFKDEAVFEGDAPVDLAGCHDDYIYRAES